MTNMKITTIEEVVDAYLRTAKTFNYKYIKYTTPNPLVNDYIKEACNCTIKSTYPKNME